MVNLNYTARSSSPDARRRGLPLLGAHASPVHAPARRSALIRIVACGALVLLVLYVLVWLPGSSKSSAPASSFESARARQPGSAKFPNVPASAYIAHDDGDGDGDDAPVQASTPDRHDRSELPASNARPMEAVPNAADIVVNDKASPPAPQKHSVAGNRAGLIPASSDGTRVAEPKVGKPLADGVVTAPNNSPSINHARTNGDHSNDHALHVPPTESVTHSAILMQAQQVARDHAARIEELTLAVAKRRRRSQPASTNIITETDAVDTTRSEAPAWSTSTFNRIGLSRIPPLVHIMTKGVLDPQAADCVDEWRRKNPGVSVLLWTDDDMDAMVSVHAPYLQPLFRALPRGVLRADLFRYLVVATFGGVYADSDACPLKPLDQWLPSVSLRADKGVGSTTATADSSDAADKLSPLIGNEDVALVIGMESDLATDDWYRFFARQLQLCQWTFAGVAGHPILTAIVAESVQRLRAKWAAGLGESGWPTITNEDVLDLTGPGVFTDVILAAWRAGKYQAAFEDLHYLSEPRRFGDAILLPIVAFSPGQPQPGSNRPGIVGDRNSPGALIRHLFLGSWRAEGDALRNSL
ncbi:membrane-bound alpha-1,6- mannosyltransferase Initiation-specific [Allomyces arbusculus]|nr:membrane-bound alpha-1,6- mannosyltransferase Initiation-specific [Allomyces arbusculus]